MSDTATVDDDDFIRENYIGIHRGTRIPRLLNNVVVSFKLHYENDYSTKSLYTDINLLNESYLTRIPEDFFFRKLWKIVH